MAAAVWHDRRMPAPTRDDWKALATLFALVASVYFATFVGVTSSNDGSHYALVRALADGRGFEISPYLEFTEFQDYALNGDRRYSDRPPGTALWTAPFYLAGRFLPEPVLVPASKHDAGQPLLMGIAAATATAGAGAVGLFFLLLRDSFGLSAAAAVLASLALAFGTVLWKYGSVLYSHAVSALFVLLALYLIARATRTAATGFWTWFAVGITTGATVLVEYTNVVFAALLALFSAAHIVRNLRASTRIKVAAATVLGAAVPAVLLMAYNTVNFGGPFELSTFNVDTTIWPQNENFNTDFATPLLVGLRAMLVWGGDNQGLGLMSPVALLALPGLVMFWRSARRDFILLMGLFAAMLLLFSKSTTFNPLTNDGRYLTPFLGLWFVPLAFWLDRVCFRARRGAARLAWAALVFGLLFLSVRNVFWHIALSWNYDLDYAALQAYSVNSSNLKYALGTVFPNAANVWWLWWLYAGVSTLAWGLWNLRTRFVKSRSRIVAH